jgi:hypothetical protein
MTARVRGVELERYVAKERWLGRDGVQPHPTSRGTPTHSYPHAHDTLTSTTAHLTQVELELYTIGDRSD